MNQSLILLPMAGMFLLTFFVFVRLYVTRIAGIRAAGIMPRTRADLDRLPPPAVNAAANFQNLFELPVIFYAVVLAVYVLHRVDIVFLACAWAFLLLRIAHSVIHCTYNRIMHRFCVYAAGALCLWIMVFRFAYVLVWRS